MKLIDRDGRLFGKISVIDLLVIGVVAIIAVAVYVKDNATPTGSGTVKEQSITFQVRATGLEDYLAAAIRVGDKLYDVNYSSGNGPVGEITQVQVLNDPGTALEESMLDGTLPRVQVEGTVDVLVTIEGSGVSDGRSYSINRVYEVGVNSSRTYRTNRVTFNGTVAGILD
mgnify:CR=1 FL=1